MAVIYITLKTIFIKFRVKKKSSHRATLYDVEIISAGQFTHFALSLFRYSYLGILSFFPFNSIIA